MEKIFQFDLKKSETGFPALKIRTAKQAEQFIRQFYCDDIEVYESFFMLALDASCKTIGFAKISQGGISSTIVDIRLVCKYAIDSLASSIIIAHNHPSGNINPSTQDLRITEDIKKALDIFSIKLDDHIIITKENYYSFANEEKL